MLGAENFLWQKWNLPHLHSPIFYTNSSIMIFDKYANLKYKYGNRVFWCRGYYVDTVGKNKTAIEEYIRNQIQEDIAYEQITMKEYLDPFTGSKKK